MVTYGTGLRIMPESIKDITMKIQQDLNFEIKNVFYTISFDSPIDNQVTVSRNENALVNIGRIHEKTLLKVLAAFIDKSVN